MKYDITIKETVYYDFEVEARNDGEAEVKARKEFNKRTTQPYCYMDEEVVHMVTKVDRDED